MDVSQKQQTCKRKRRRATLWMENTLRLSARSLHVQDQTLPERSYFHFLCSLLSSFLPSFLFLVILSNQFYSLLPILPFRILVFLYTHQSVMTLSISGRKRLRYRHKPNIVSENIECFFLCLPTKYLARVLQQTKTKEKEKKPQTFDMFVSNLTAEKVSTKLPRIGSEILEPHLNVFGLLISLSRSLYSVTA